MNTFFEELKRRNVVRVAIAYAAVSWLILQLGDVAADNLSFPEWFMPMIFVVLGLGFPVALIISWAFELTPDGLKKTEEVDADKSIATNTGQKLNYFIIATLALAVVFLVYERQTGLSPLGKSTNSTNASIAVLPFVNMSADPDQVFFSDGISEEILNVLVRIPNLQVAGRTSSFQYKGQNQDLREIGATLNVGYILEGSVRKDLNGQIRITAQLIRSEDGFHLWSETYDRDLNDIFQIQEDIARAIAEQLTLSLGLGDERQLVSDRTDNIEAYEMYLRAKRLVAQRGGNNLREAMVDLQTVVAMDPEFAPGWSLLAQVGSLYVSYVELNGIEEMRAYENLTFAAANRALVLNPNNGSARSILAYYHLYRRELQKAIEQIDLALAAAPDDPAVLDYASQLLLELGYTKRPMAYSERTVAIDPLVPIYNMILAGVYEFRDMEEAALEQLLKTTQLDPTFAFGWGNMVFYAVNYKRKDIYDLAYPQLHQGGGFGSQRLDHLQFVSEHFDDPAALVELLEEPGLSPFIRTIAATLTGDIDIIINATRESFWEQEFPPVLGLMNTGLDGFYQHPEWKAYAEEIGLFDLWRSYGVPERCKDDGEGGFVCVARGAPNDIF